jgi:hypothetical protein
MLGIVRHRSLIAAATLGFALVGCQSHKQAAPPAQTAAAPPRKPVTKPAPPTPLDIKSAELGGPTWKPAWNQIVERDLPPAMLSSAVPRDVRRFCPRFDSMSRPDRRAFWAYFFEALASAEAGLNPKANVRHLEPEVDVIDPQTHLPTHQAGLLQLKYQDAARYNCNFDWTRDRHLPLHDPNRTILRPENNLQCGVNILYHQLFEQQKPLITPTAYWATLHPGNPGYRNFLKQMTNPPSACGLRSRWHRSRRGAQPLRTATLTAGATPATTRP